MWHDNSKGPLFLPHPLDILHLSKNFFLLINSTTIDLGNIHCSCWYPLFGYERVKSLISKSGKFVWLFYTAIASFGNCRHLVSYIYIVQGMVYSADSAHTMMMMLILMLMMMLSGDYDDGKRRQRNWLKHGQNLSESNRIDDWALYVDTKFVEVDLKSGSCLYYEAQISLVSVLNTVGRDRCKKWSHILLNIHLKWISPARYPWW